MRRPWSIAVRSSRCAVCDEKIEEGDPIVLLEDDEEWVHQECAYD